MSSDSITASFIELLYHRFLASNVTIDDLDWIQVKNRIINNDKLLQSLQAMESTGGEPSLVAWNIVTDKFVFIDSAKESPLGRRSLCYDKAAWESRKQHKPIDNACDVAIKMGIRLLTEKEYKKYHTFFGFDSKTSSWIDTPASIRKLGGALFCDYRFGTVFTYHNGADSYYAARGFRGILEI